MKKKLLFVTETLGGGGAEKVLLSLLQHLDRSQFEITVCTVWDTGVYAPHVRELVDSYVSLLEPMEQLHGIHRWFANKKRRWIYRRLPARWVYKLFVPKGNDVEVAWLEGVATRIVAGSSNKEAKKYAWIHCNLAELPLLDRVIKGRRAQQQSLSRYDAVVGVSHTASAAVRHLYGLENVVTLYNPIDADVIRKQALLGMNELPTKKAAFRIVSVARLHPQKGSLRLLRAVKRLRDEGVSLELWMVGDGEERESCEAFIRSHQLEKWVTLWEFQKNPYPLIYHSDLYVCASLSEGWGVSITEALVLGVPVVSTCRFEGESDGRDEFCVITDNNEDALCQGISNLLRSPGKWESMRRQIAANAEKWNSKADFDAITNFLNR